MNSRLRRQQRQQLSIQLLKELYRGINGFNLSSSFRENLKELDGPEYTYGEIVPQSFIQILLLIEKEMNEIEPKKSRCFVDLGCGLGRACFVAAFSPSSSFDRIYGIEIVDSLVDVANQVKSLFFDSLSLCLNQSKNSIPVPQKAITKKTSKINILEMLIQLLKDISIQTSSESIDVEILANRICKVLGHKDYKLALKPYKSFLKLLQSFPNEFQFSESNRKVSLIVNSIEPIPSCTTSCSSLNPSEADDMGKSQCSTFEAIDDSPDSEITSECRPSHLPLSAQLDLNRSAVVSLLLPHCPNTSINTSPNNIPLLCPVPCLSPLPSEFHFLQGDIFSPSIPLPLPSDPSQSSPSSSDSFSWTEEADVVFVASLLFSPLMIESLSRQVLLLQPGSWVITLKPLLLSISSSLEKKKNVVEEQTETSRSSIHDIDEKNDEDRKDNLGESKKEESETLHSHPPSTVARSAVLRYDSFFRMSWQMARVYIYQIQE